MRPKLSAAWKEGFGAKIVHRRGTAQIGLGFLDEAWFDFEMASDVEPTTYGIQRERS